MSRVLWPLYCAATFSLCQVPLAVALDSAAPSEQQPVATTRHVLSLADAIKRALFAHPEIQASQSEWLAAQAALQQAGALPNPELSLLMEDLRAGKRTTTLQLAEKLELGGKRQARSRVAASGVELALLDQQAKRQALQAAVSDAFYQALTAQERVSLCQAALTLAQKVKHIASQRLAAGKVAPIEESKATVAEATARLELTQALSEQRAALSQLASLMGQSQVDFSGVDGQLPLLPAALPWSQLAHTLQDAPEPQRATRELERRQAEVELQRALRTPDITLSAGVKRDELAGETMAVAGFSIPIPLFQPSQGNLREALHRADKAQAEQQASLLRTRSQLAQALQRYQTTREEAENLQQIVLPAASNAHDLALRGYELGKYSLLDVQDAQRSLLQVRNQYLRARLEALRSATEIERIVGGPNSAWLAGKSLPFPE